MDRQIDERIDRHTQIDERVDSCMNRQADRQLDRLTRIDRQVHFLTFGSFIAKINTAQLICVQVVICNKCGLVNHIGRPGQSLSSHCGKHFYFRQTNVTLVVECTSEAIMLSESRVTGRTPFDSPYQKSQNNGKQCQSELT